MSKHRRDSIRPGITPQRMFSMAEGTVRQNPMRPLARPSGIVSFGQQPMVIAQLLTQVKDAAYFAEREEAERLAYNADKQARRAHDCSFSIAGAYCPHAN